ncbi:alpha/beta hydrolase fold-domain-containing protein [Amylocarpus encephaloides]|uniref:Alpha/beta hydrolase fold-domain-containing protein n=1 Tax=Amylocarpus encephaloides TaxID=45428 RepID=A0A9P7YBP6_9HELO|nr:alpha/beta hydrolase fold-domain-containing protein [Amylocarpus encephaloides]
MAEPLPSSTNTNVKSSINVDHRESRSVTSAALQMLVDKISPLLFKYGDPQLAGSPQLKPHKRAEERTPVRESKLEDIFIYTFTNDSAGVDKPILTHKLYYFAGGGFQGPPTKEHWLLCSELAVKLPAYQVNLVSYPLAPNSPAVHALPALYRLCDALSQQARAEQKWITLMGDSAGANVALTMGLHAAANALRGGSEGKCQLRNIMAISPPTDFRNQNPDIDAISSHDPVLSRTIIDDAANAWRGDWPPEEPQVSPIFADLSLFQRVGIKVDGVIAGHDVLSPDAIVFRQRLGELGVYGDWLQWDKQMHCFPIMFPYHIHEGVAGKDWILDILRRNARSVDSFPPSTAESA